MSFHDIKKDSRRMRIKEVDIYNGGDLTARREQCWSPWCNTFVEELGKSNRCGEPECEAMLLSKAIEQKKMAYVAALETWYGNIDSLLVNPANKPVGIRNEAILARYDAGPKLELCECGKGGKMPRRDICNECYRAAKAAEMNTRRAGRKAAKRDTRVRTNDRQSGFHRISGLKLK